MSWIQTRKDWLLGLMRAIKGWLPSTEWWAAVAAIAAAYAAWLTLTEQREAARDAIRPELVLSGWQFLLREPEKFSEVTIDRIANIGNGPAFNVLVMGLVIREGDKLPVVPQLARISVLAEDDGLSLGAKLSLSIPAANDYGRSAAFEVKIGYSDSRGMRYTTTYSMLATDIPIGFGEKVTPNVMLRDRWTVEGFFH